MKVTYDYHEMAFEVDGRRKAYPFARRPFAYKACSIGLPGGRDTGPRGMKKIVPYRGDLREFRIYHHTERTP